MTTVLTGLLGLSVIALVVLLVAQARDWSNR